MQTINGYDCTVEQVKKILRQFVGEEYSYSMATLEAGKSVALHGRWPFRGLMYKVMVFQKTIHGYGIAFDKPIRVPYPVKP
jgi:hypothetical protein